jgi:hypothetical protein
MLMLIASDDVYVPRLDARELRGDVGLTCRAG